MAEMRSLFEAMGVLSFIVAAGTILAVIFR
jgi:hypothetical protein